MSNAKRSNNSKLTIACSAELRQRFNTFCKVRGLSVGQVLSMFAVSIGNSQYEDTIHQFLYEDTEQGILESTVVDDGENGKKRVMISANLTDEARSALYDVCTELNIPLSILVRKFMLYCVKHNNVPFSITRKGHCKRESE